MTSATAVIPFQFQSHAVRVVQRDGSPWFVAHDVCEALGYANSRSAVADHLDDDERSTVANADSRNGGGKLTIINESGLYALVLRSRKPEARKFAKWVTGEVLPAIRKTGGYGAAPAAHAPLPEKAAVLAAIKAANDIGSALLMQLLKSGIGAPTYERYMACFDDQGNAVVRELPIGSLVMTWADVARRLRDVGCTTPTNIELADIAAAATSRLSRRMTSAELVTKVAP